MHPASSLGSRRWLNRSTLVRATALAMTLVACSDQTPTEVEFDPGPPLLHVVGGDGQEGTVGTELPQPLVVKVTTPRGFPIPLKLINFVVVEGGGRVFAGASMTNLEGIAREYWTLGPTPGRNVLEARAIDPLTGAKQVFATFVATATPPPGPPAPSNLVATTVSSTQIDLTWTDNASDEADYLVERCLGDGCTSGFAQIAALAPNTTSFSHLGLIPATFYTYRVRVRSGSVFSGYSNGAVAKTLDAGPDAPSNLVATAVSSTQIDLTWTDNSSNENGFRIERCIGTGAVCFPSSFVELAVVGPNVTSFSNVGLVPGTFYTYRVRANHAAGSSPYSNNAEARTAEPPPP